MKLTLLLFFCLITFNHAFSQNRIEHPEKNRIPYADKTDLAATDAVSAELLSKISNQVLNTSLKLEIGQSNDDYQTRRVIKEFSSGSSQSVTFKSDTKYDIIAGFTDLDEEIVLVQTLRNYPRSENRFPVLTTYALDKSVGNISLINSVPSNWILLATAQDQMVVNGIMMNRVP